MKCFTSLASIAAVALLAGCSANAVDTASGRQPDGTSAAADPRGGPPAAGTWSPAAATLDVDANLRALRELQVFELGAVVENIPEGANCYRLACPGHERELDDAKARAAQALASFTRVALAAAADTSADAQIEADGTCYRSDETNLQTLMDLHVVEVGELVLEKPESFDNCYHVPRAHKLARIAAAVRKP
ncbi:hypothetical protein BH11MYX4_BH11MYX4_04530 [soil metagenome]